MHSEKVILIVEDDELLHFLYEQSLKIGGFEGKVYFTTSISDTKRLLNDEQRLDVIFWDNEVKDGEVIETDLISFARMKFKPTMVASSSSHSDIQMNLGCSERLNKLKIITEVPILIQKIFSNN